MVNLVPPRRSIDHLVWYVIILLVLSITTLGETNMSRRHDHYVSVTVSPTTASLQPGQQTQFTATVSGTRNTAVTWTASGGTVTSSGQYTAPSSAGTYTLTATSVAKSSEPASAVVTVNPVTVVSATLTSVSLTPATVVGGSSAKGTVTLSGAAPAGGALVTLASNSAAAQVGASVTVAAGTTTAAFPVATSTVAMTTAASISAAYNSSTQSATLTVSPPSQISISISPGTASLQTGGQQQFTALVSGTSNTAVTWSASSGTVTTSGSYVAPSAAGTYTVTAVSAADPTKSASATVSVSAATAISVSVSPTTVALSQASQQQFAATVSGSSNTAATWAVTQGTGTITQSGLYTAPQSAETDIVVATSQAASTKSASASITVVAPHSVALSWSPPSSSSISYYDVYRGTVSGGPYTLLAGDVSSTSYTDSSVQSGGTYYYVTTAVDSSGEQSAYSNIAQAVIPTP